MYENGTPFDEIYEMFLDDVKSRELNVLIEKNEGAAREFLRGLLRKACVRFKLCTKDLQNTTEYGFVETLDDEEMYILSIGMRLHWVTPQVNQESIMRKQIRDRDFEEHPTFRLLETLIALKKETEYELRKLERDYSWNGFR